MSIAEKSLRQDIANCLADWSGDWDIDIEHEFSNEEEGYAYFNVIIRHALLGRDYEFAARVSGSYCCEMEFTEEYWVDLNMGNLFSYLWYETATPREVKND